MRIIIATDNYYPNVNGASYFAQRLAYQLKENYNNVLVLAPSQSVHNQTFTHDGVEIFGLASLPVERIRIPFPLIIDNAMEQTIQNFKPDIIHIQSHFSVSRKAAQIGLKLGIPVVGTNHFMPENLVPYVPLPHQAEGWVKKQAWAWFLKTFNKIDAITTPTQTAAGLLQGIGLNKPVTVISNGIDLKRFKPSNNGNYLRANLRLPNVPILLYVGRLDREKHLNLVLRALEPVVKLMPVHFVIAGTGAEEKGLIHLTYELGISEHVTFAGFVSDIDLPNLYAISHCFIMAGTAELQSIATMEAMATGLPIIAANAMALPELVRHGVNGFLFQHEDIVNMSAAIQQIFGNPQLHQQFSAQSLGLIAPHDITQVTNRFITLYSQLQQQHVTART